MSFAMDVRLQRDTLTIGDLPLCRVLLMNDFRWPWLILVPRRQAAIELTDLSPADRALLTEEMATTAAFLQRHTRAEKINIGALGNIVRQLHVHVVARFVNDAAWPGPVWGFGAATPYVPAVAEAMIAAAMAALRPALAPDNAG